MRKPPHGAQCGVGVGLGAAGGVGLVCTGELVPMPVVEPFCDGWTEFVLPLGCSELPLVVTGEVDGFEGVVLLWVLDVGVLFVCCWSVGAELLVSEESAVCWERTSNTKVKVSITKIMPTIIIRFWVSRNSVIFPRELLVETRGFEPRTSCLQSRRSSQLSYVPLLKYMSQPHFAAFSSKSFDSPLCLPS